MINVRIIDTLGKDEVHKVIKFTVVGDSIWFYTDGMQYYIPQEDVQFMQVWESKDVDN